MDEQLRAEFEKLLMLEEADLGWLDSMRNLITERANGSKGIAPLVVAYVVNLETLDNTIHTFDLTFAPFQNATEKCETMQRIGKQIYDCRDAPLAIALGAESWISKQRPGRFIEPQHDPAREEGVLLSCVTVRPKRTMITTAEISRDSSNGIRLGEWSEPRDAEAALVEQVVYGWILAAAESRS